MPVFSLAWLAFLSLWVFPSEDRAVALDRHPPARGIRTEDGFTSEQLVRDIFVKGACENTFDIKPVGDQRGIGYFENGAQSIGIERGIILSTGAIGNAHGPNNSTEKSSDFGDQKGDRDLRRMTRNDGRVLDVVGIEFDFIPLDSVVTFRYVFASEEYCQFVGAEYNDVFGFFVSGPGIRGEFSNQSENVALVPGTSDFVSINTINHTKNANFFIRNELQGEAENECGLDWSPSPFNQEIQYDGFTKVLTATVRLIPCETYRMRMVIADVSDHIYDSAVFLEAESFNIGGDVRLNAGSNLGQDTIPEGCNYGFFELQRADTTQLEDSITIGVRVAPVSTAVPGQDFDPLPPAITIPAGQQRFLLPITLRVDPFNEPVESLILELDFPCACISDTARLYIKDPPPIQSGIEPQVVCAGETLVLTPEVTGGVAPYVVEWPGASPQGDTLRVRPLQDTSVSVRLRDDCGRSIEERIPIKVLPAPSVQITGEQRICEGDTAWLRLRFDGVPPFSGIIEDTVSGARYTFEEVDTSVFEYPVAERGSYQVVELVDGQCSGWGVGSAEITTYVLQGQLVTEDVSCHGGSDGSAKINMAGGNPPYTYTWTNDLAFTDSVGGLPAGRYELRITDAQGCILFKEIELGEPAPLRPVSFDCSGSATGYNISAGGGTPPYRYSVDGITFQDAGLFLSLTAGEQYRLRIRDSEGCTLAQDFIMPATYDRMVSLPPRSSLPFGVPQQIDPQLQIPESLIAEVLWEPALGLSCTDCLRPVLTPSEPLTYRIQVTDIFGCRASAAMQIKVERQIELFVPNAFSPDGDGNNETLSIFANTDQVERVLSFQIFSRWGNQVYQRADFLPNDPDSSWDGRYQGKLLDAGSYIYTIQLLLVDGSKEQYSGVINIIR